MPVTESVTVGGGADDTGGADSDAEMVTVVMGADDTGEDETGTETGALLVTIGTLVDAIDGQVSKRARGWNRTRVEADLR